MLLLELRLCLKPKALSKISFMKSHEKPKPILILTDGQYPIEKNTFILYSISRVNTPENNKIYNHLIGRDHYLSFAWCVYDKLVTIKKEKASIRRSLQLSSLEHKFRRGLNLYWQTIWIWCIASQRNSQYYPDTECSWVRYLKVWI